MEASARLNYVDALERTRIVQDEAMGNYLRVMSEVTRLRSEFANSAAIDGEGSDEGELVGNNEYKNFK